ncbi:Zn(2)-Cys(6) binuclear cluster domain-containing protein [Mycena crocata]|nr:Zn(2)-Cys(6) binuclear cluster domain-containing protein [Mycena crocata]
MSPNTNSSVGRGEQTGTLRRGQACFNCRRRKMRCDGAHPTCGQCERANRPEDCEYISGQNRAKVQILQESITRVESRIYELEHPQQAQTGILLHQPYQASAEDASRRGRQGTASEPAMDMVKKLLDYFLPYSFDVGFFLNVPRFRSAALLPYSIGHHARPSAAVLSASYLWGLRLSSSPRLMAHEPEFLARALKFTATGLSDTHPHKIMHNMQAEVLLSYYFAAAGRFLEAKFHTAAFCSLGLGAALNTIRSANVVSFGSLGPPRDAVEEGERIHACWTGVVLDKLQAVVLGEDPAKEISHEGFSLDTPWPLELDDYQMGQMNPNALYSSTVKTFLTGSQSLDAGMSSIALLVKAALLGYLTHVFSSARAKLSVDMPYEQLASAKAIIYNLDRQIDGLRAAILAVQQRTANPSGTMIRTFVVVHSVLHVATVQLHNIPVVHGDVESHHKRVASARAVLEIIETAPQQHFAYINPIMGTVWMLACQVVIDEIRELKALHTMGQRQGQEGAVLAGSLTRAVVAMSAFSKTGPLLNYQISRIQEACAAL